MVRAYLFTIAIFLRYLIPYCRLGGPKFNLCVESWLFKTRNQNKSCHQSQFMSLTYYKTGALHILDHCSVIAVTQGHLRRLLLQKERQHGSLICVHNVYIDARACYPTIIQVLLLHEPQSPSEGDLDPSTAAKRHVCCIRCDPEGRDQYGRLRNESSEACSR